nr:hypothetical protein B0A51_02145 [Rachicladosporium sp. CCFEE 5018]
MDQLANLVINELASAVLWFWEADLTDNIATVMEFAHRLVTPDQFTVVVARQQPLFGGVNPVRDPTRIPHHFLRAMHYLINAYSQISFAMDAVWRLRCQVLQGVIFAIMARLPQ